MKTINKLIIVAVFVLTATTSFGQCTFTVTDSQPFVESFDDGLECWTVEAICGGGMESEWATPVTIALPSQCCWPQGLIQEFSSSQQKIIFSEQILKQFKIRIIPL